VLLLPPGQAAHVSLRGLSGGPKIGDEREEVEEEDEGDGPFHGGGDGGDGVALRGGFAVVCVGVAAALRRVSGVRVETRPRLSKAKAGGLMEGKLETGSGKRTGIVDLGKT
jgi:hypothetical protein